MNEPPRSTFPKCDKCEHQFHGLPCPASVRPLIGPGSPATPCGCAGAFDDDFWNGPPA